ncbi:MAG: hypothetical protein GC152_14610 [Alphaproteobacteria bacterium]|nr:hypothetical protein [Alphaproteobacteria bacterium]
MFGISGPIRRLIGLVAIFLAFVASGVASFQVLGGSFGSPAFDAYKVLQLFVLSGDWVFGPNSNWFVRRQAFIAPVFTVIGIIEIFTAQFFFRIWQASKLARMDNHAVIAGLTRETMFLLASLRHAKERVDVAIVDARFDDDMRAMARRLGAVTIEGDAASPAALKVARIDRAQIAISFLPEAVDSLQFVLSANSLIEDSRKAGAPRNPGGDARSVDLWVRLQDAGLGSRLGTYFKFAGLSAAAHPRFFSIDEIAARRLIRAHPPDLYADALGQTRVHLVLFGHNALSIQVIAECLRQTTVAGDANVTVLTADPEVAERELRAIFPSIDDMVNLEVRLLTVHASGISQADYLSLPTDASMNVICFEKPEASVNAALSLRRMLLVPPDIGDATVERRTNAPILVRLSNTRGIGELLRSNVDKKTQRGAGASDAESEIPDGIFAFGAIEDLLTGDAEDLFVPTLIDPMRERLARALHESYVENRSANDAAAAGVRTAPSWEVLSQDFRESSRQAADHIWAKARALRLRLVDGVAGASSLNLSDEENQRLAELEHNRWVNERLLNGWSRGAKRVDAARRHNLLRPWSELSASERMVDERLAGRLEATVRSVGKTLQRELVVGVVGHRPTPGREFDERHVALTIRAKLEKLVRDHPDRAVVLVTCLAEGADTIAAEVAIGLGIPYWVPLPMPYEAYSQDFMAGRTVSDADGGAALRRFRRLVALSERYLELPLKFGDLTEISLSQGDYVSPRARDHQYALAGAYIVERSDVVLAVWDGRPSQGVGGTGDVVAWRAAGEAPREFATPAAFRMRPAITPAVIIRPTAD